MRRLLKTIVVTLPPMGCSSNYLPSPICLPTLSHPSTMKLTITCRLWDALDMSETVFTYTRAAIQETSAPFLEHYIEDGRSGAARRGSCISRPFLPSEVEQKIAKWIGDPFSSFLWVEGPVYTPAEQQLSAIATLLCDMALGGETPVPYVLFTPKSTYPARQAPDPKTRQERVFIAMLYSLAGQLVRLLPEQLDSTPHGSFERRASERLDGSMASAPAALDLVESLLAHGPPTLMVVINRL